MAKGSFMRLCAQQDLATNTYAGDFVIADATLYWTDITAGRVYAVPLPP